MDDLDNDLDFDISAKREDNIHQVRLATKAGPAIHWASRNRTGGMHCECQEDGTIVLSFAKPQDALMVKILFR